MKTKINTIYLFASLCILVVTGCEKEGEQGPAGQDGVGSKVYYSQWITPTAWSGNSGDWYFNVNAPDLTEDIVENGVILAYAWLAGDIYDATAVRPLPTYAVDANWSFLISEYENIEFTTDMISKPLTTGNNFRFIAIPGNIETLKSISLKNKREQELRQMSYKDVCEYFNIPE
jgi:hypothetical protein